MPQIDVKITDLDQIQELKNSDLFLIAHPMAQVDGNPIANYPYTSNSISGGALSSTIKHALEGDNLSISGSWNFHTNEKNIPTQDVHFSTGDFITALETTSCLTSMVNDNNEDGWYFNLPTSFCQDPDKRSDTAQSLSVTNNSVANIDFVERAIAGAYKSLLNQLTTIISPYGDSHFIPTHVGEIVYSTRFSKAEYSEDGQITAGFNLNDPSQATNIRQFYGYGQTINGVKYPNTKWILHSDYFLRGANSNVVKNSTSDGFGGQDYKDYDVPLKEHNHLLNASANPSVSGGKTEKDVLTSISGSKNYDERSGHSEDIFAYNTSTKGKVSISGINVNFNGSQTTENAGDNTKIRVDHLPRYKNVYIWERIA